VKALAGFSTAMFLGQFLGQLSRSIASVVIGSVIGPAAVGQYQIGSRALDLLNSVVIQPIQGVALSAFSEVQRQNGSLWKAYLRMTRLTAVVACPAHLGLAAVAPDFVRLVFGPQWDQAVWILMTLALGIGPLSLNLFQGAILAAAGRPDLNLKAMILSTMAIALTAVATVWFGVVGVAIGLTVRLYLTTPINLRFVARGLGTSAWEPVRNVLPVFACALVMAAVVAALRIYLADQEPILRLAACVACGCLVYPLLLLVFARPALADAIDSITPMLPGRLGRILRLR
jgi:PST family polysaccharide transporter